MQGVGGQAVQGVGVGVGGSGSAGGRGRGVSTGVRYKETQKVVGEVME